MVSALDASNGLALGDENIPQTLHKALERAHWLRRDCDGGAGHIGQQNPIAQPHGILALTRRETRCRPGRAGGHSKAGLIQDATATWKQRGERYYCNAFCTEDAFWAEAEQADWPPLVGSNLPPSTVKSVHEEPVLKRVVHTAVRCASSGRLTEPRHVLGPHPHGGSASVQRRRSVAIVAARVIAARSVIAAGVG
jgi:hypothetical protein